MLKNQILMKSSHYQVMICVFLQFGPFYKKTLQNAKLHLKDLPCADGGVIETEGKLSIYGKFALYRRKRASPSLKFCPVET